MAIVNIEDYIIEKQSTKNTFGSNSFKDTSDIHKYLTNKSSKEEYRGEYEAVSAIIDFYSDLYNYAEERQKNNNLLDVLNIQRALPIELTEINDLLEHENEGPPLRLITKIAMQDYGKIKQLTDSMHKILERERELIAAERVQQLDAQCMRWLTRQPGVNIAQKAGDKQKLMAVVRYESFNTLENRVLKHFLLLCLNNAKTYLHEYKSKYEMDEKVVAVQRLASLARGLLDTELFKSILTIYERPIPNYVLQNNPLYARVWELYSLLLRRTKLIEMVWAHRQKAYRELTIILFLAILHKRCIGKSRIKYNLWISPFPNADGCICDQEFPIYLNLKEQTGEVAGFDNLNSQIRYFFGRNFISLSLAYVPNTANEIVVNKPNLLIFHEPETEIKSYSAYVIKVSNDIVQDLYSCIKRLR